MFNINTDFTEAKNKTKELFNFLNNLEKEINEDSLRTLYALHDALKSAELNYEVSENSLNNILAFYDRKKSTELDSAPVEGSPVVSTSVISAVTPSSGANNAVQAAPEVAVSLSMPISPSVA